MKKITPELALRIGLAGTFLYAGVNSLLNPTAWIGYIPQWVELLGSPLRQVVPELVEGLQFRQIFLTLHGIFEILLAIALLVGIRKKLTALLAFLSLAAIVITYGIDDVSFRDFGLLAATYALMLLSKSQHLNISK
ncbi:MAG: DoxX family membrane protein [bacterium]|nr:DoxX family membrane protein [bacterium]